MIINNELKRMWKELVLSMVKKRVSARESTPLREQDCMTQWRVKLSLLLSYLSNALDQSPY
jgi:hypothetical protein